MKYYSMNILVLILLFSNCAMGKNSSSFNTGYGTKSSRTNRPSKPRYGFGLGVNLPDLVPFSFRYRQSRFWSLKVFLVPTIPFNIKVEMPEDRISSKNGIVLSHPEYEVNFEANYGPQYGMELIINPFGGNFYLGAGLSFRKLAISGGISSPLSLSVQGSDSTISTNSIFSIDAAASTSQYVLRLSTGLHWNLFGGYFINIGIGITKPYKANSSFSSTSAIINPRSPTQRISDALLEFKNQEDLKMKEKALEAMIPVEKLVLPIIGLEIGIYI